MRSTTRVLAAAAAACACVCVTEALVTPRSSTDPIVDLGYANYQGYYDSTYALNVWKR